MEPNTKKVVVMIDDKEYIIIDHDGETDTWTLFPWYGDTDHDVTMSTDEVNKLRIVGMVETN